MNAETQNKGRRILVFAGYLIAAGCTGALLACSFPPVEEHQAAWVALVPLIICARYTSPGRMFFVGLLSGIIFWLASLSWLLKLAGRGTNMLGAASGWMGLSLYCAIYLAVFAMIVAYLFEKIKYQNKENSKGYRFWYPGISKKIAIVLLIPAVWVGLEYIRSIIFTGFPWNLLGVSQFRNTVFIQVADIGGVYAVSFLLASMSASIGMVVLGFADVYVHRKPMQGLRVELFTGLMICALCWSYGVRKGPAMSTVSDDALRLRVAAVQPNIPQIQKWTPDFEELIFSNLEANTDLASRTAPDLIVWPETAITRAYEVDPVAINFVANIVKKAGAPLLMGAMENKIDKSFTGDPLELKRWDVNFYNSSYLVSKTGVIAAKYRKQHLVPFGEYLPFDKKIPLLKRIAPLGYSCTAGEEPVVFTLPVESSNTNSPASEIAYFSSLICFEDVFSYLSRDAVKAGARLLINQTNDGWFDGSCGALQHMSHCVFRCIENRVPAVRCTNTGVTCMIGRSGRIQITDNPHGTLQYASQEMVLQGVDMPLTFYTRFGDKPFAMPCGILSACLFVLVLKSRKRNDNDSSEDSKQSSGVIEEDNDD